MRTGCPWPGGIAATGQLDRLGGAVWSSAPAGRHEAKRAGVAPDAIRDDGAPGAQSADAGFPSVKRQTL
jgi:hypothetical protein